MWQRLSCSTLLIYLGERLCQLPASVHIQDAIIPGDKHSRRALNPRISFEKLFAICSQSYSQTLGPETTVLDSRRLQTFPWGKFNLQGCRNIKQSFAQSNCLSDHVPLIWFPVTLHSCSQWIPARPSSH